MKRLQSHDENEKIDEFKIQLNILKNEMKKLQADMKNLKKDS
jgi:molecular chaperone GrpE (heat shock protein)